MGYRIMSKTEDQYEAEHIQRMGQPLGVVFNELYSELVWLYVKWAEFVDLFGTDPERVDLLNRAAPNFFGIIQEVLFEHITLHVARLTDRVKSLGKENLTVQELPILVQPEMREPPFKDSSKKQKFERSFAVSGGIVASHTMIGH